LNIAWHRNVNSLHGSALLHSAAATAGVMRQLKFKTPAPPM